MSNTGSLTLRKLIAQREQLDAEIHALRTEIRDGKLAEAIALIEEFEFTPYELGLVKTQQLKRAGKDSPTFKQKVKNPPVPPLYRDPNTGATWSGRGRQPLWMQGERDEYLIGDKA